MVASFDHRPSGVAGVPFSWGMAVGVSAVVAARWLAFGAPGARAVAGAAALVVVLAVSVAGCHRCGRPVMAAALVLACSPTVFVATADGRWQGGVAVLTIALAVWSRRPAVAASLSLVATVGLVAWWRSGFDRGDAPGPSWRAIVGETGDVLRRAMTSIGLEERPIPMTAALLSALGVGIVVGSAVLTGRWARASLVPASLGLLVLGIWSIRLWRGAVDPLGGAWVLSTAVVLVAAAGEPRAAAGRRLAVALAFVGVAVWWSAILNELGGRSTAAAALTTFGVGSVAVALIAPSMRGRRVAAPGQ